MNKLRRRSKKFRILLGRVGDRLSTKNIIALLFLLACLLGCWWLLTALEINLLTPEGLAQAAQEMGVFAILIYIFSVIIAIVISPIPGTPLTIAAGAIWGPIPATIYATIGSFTGGLIAYFIGRTLGRSAVKALTGKIIYFSKHRGEVYLGLIMFLARLLPVLPFDFMSYGAGLAKLSLPIYASASLLGAFPCNFFLTHLGAAFTLNRTILGIMASLFLILFVGLPWGIQRYNWLGMKDVIRLE
jgi:uncharacterized membrane protein YdjX (TVP38/TMEM64 family)